MNKKGMYLLLTVFICISTLLVTGAGSVSAKDMALSRLKNFNLPEAGKYFNGEYASNMHYEVEKLAGELVSSRLKKIMDGSTVEVNSKFDMPRREAEMNIKARVDSNEYQGKMMVNGNRMIMDKGLVGLLEKLINEEFPVEKSRYMYFDEENLFNSTIGTGQSGYQSYKQLNSISRDLLVFIAEAIPEKYYHVAGGKVALELDQAGVEDVIYSLLKKVKAEKERAAEIILALERIGNPSSALTRTEIVKEIEAMPLPSREQVQVMANYIQFKELYYAVPLEPGGQKSFRAVLELQPASGYTGQLKLNWNARGPQGDIQGNWNLQVEVIAPGGARLTGSVDGDYTLEDSSAAVNFALQAKLSHLETGVVAFDLHLNGKETLKFEAVNIEFPALTPENSLSLDELAGPGVDRPAEPREENIVAYIDNRPVTSDVRPFINNDRMMVPLRSVAEGLNCSVDWQEPGQIIITKDLKNIQMRTGEKKYVINGKAKEMDVAPVISNGRTFVPIRFIAEAYDCEVTYQEGKVYIFTRTLQLV